MNKTLSIWFDSLCASTNKIPENGLKSFYKDFNKIYESKIIELEDGGLFLFGKTEKDSTSQVFAYLANNQKHPEGSKVKNLERATFLLTQTGAEKPTVHIHKIDTLYDALGSGEKAKSLFSQYVEIWW